MLGSQPQLLGESRSKSERPLKNKGVSVKHSPLAIAVTIARCVRLILIITNVKMFIVVRILGFGTFLLFSIIHFFIAILALVSPSKALYLHVRLCQKSLDSFRQSLHKDVEEVGVEVEKAREKIRKEIIKKLKEGK